MTEIEKRNYAVESLKALDDVMKGVEISAAPEEESDNYDPALLQQALARLAAVSAMATEEAVDELADIFAALAVKDYCTAVHRGGDYIAVVESHEMVEDVIDKHDFPTSALRDAVFEATVAIVDDMSDEPWTHVSDHDAMYGGDDPENFKPLDPEPPGDTNLSK